VIAEQHDPGKKQAGHVLADLLRHDVDASVRAQLLEAIGAGDGGQRYLTYNAHNVRIDGARDVVTVEGELDSGREETVDTAEIRSPAEQPDRCRSWLLSAKEHEMNDEKRIELSGAEALAIYKVLEEVCVSLDRIGSREAGGDDPDGRYLAGYFGEDGATLRLSDARMIMVGAVERSFTENELAEVDQGIVYWTDRHPDL